MKDFGFVNLQTKLNKAIEDLVRVQRQWDNTKGKRVEQEKELKAVRAHMEQKLKGLQVSAENEKIVLES